MLQAVPSNSDGFKDQLLQATIMQLAPNSHVMPCRHGTCCWKWAARRLMDECCQATRNSHKLKEAFYEELGDSAVQQLIDSQKAYVALQDQMRKLSDQLDAQQRSNSQLQTDLKTERNARAEVEADRDRSKQVQQDLSEKASTMAAKIEELEAEIDTLRHPKEQIESLEARCKKLEEQAVAAEETARKAEAARSKEESARRDMEFKNSQLHMYEKQHIEARLQQRRLRKAGAAGAEASKPKLPKPKGRKIVR